MVRRILCLSAAAGLLTGAACALDSATANDTAPGGSLTLAEALALTLERSPRLASYEWDIRAAEARKLQASLRPNPELSLEIEGIRWRPGPGETTDTSSLQVGVEEGEMEVPVGNGQDPIVVPTKKAAPTFEVERETVSGPGSGLSEAEYTLTLSQVAELGGKRAKRVRLAEREIDLARWDYEAARADALADTARAFVETYAAQLRAELGEEALRFGEKVQGVTRAQVEVGQVSPLELRKADVEVVMARADLQRAREELQAARYGLAAQWGDMEARFASVCGRFEEPLDVPTVAELRRRVATTPDIARWTSELERRRAVYRVERSKRIPDVTVGLGLKAEAQGSRKAGRYGIGSEGIGFSRATSRPGRDWDTSVVLEVSLPLPVFDRNQGGVQEAEYLVEKAADERRAAEIEVAAAVAEWRHALAGALHEIDFLKEEAIPTARDTFNLTQEGFQEGKLHYLDVLDAQRTLFDLRSRLIEANLDYQRGKIEIERLIGAMHSEDAQGGTR